MANPDLSSSPATSDGSYTLKTRYISYALDLLSNLFINLSELSFLMLEITVHRIKGECPVYDVGDKIVVDGPEIDIDRTDALCTHALSALLHYTTALEKGVSPVELGLSKEEGIAYMQCVDPGEGYTGGGTVIFKCVKSDEE